jgi:CheY-like chemotaxis protein
MLKYGWSMGEPAAKAILLVEDNPADVSLIQRAVAECGNNIRLSVVSNGRDALAFLRKDPPFMHAPALALILLDLNLPILDGYQVLGELRRLPPPQALPVVIFSSADKDTAEPLCLHLGASEYVQKPSTLDAFFAAIKAIVGHWLP